MPPREPEELTDKELLRRLSAIYSEGFVAGVAKELADAVELGMEKTHTDIRDRFGQRRTSGARKPRGVASPLAGALWSFRDLRVGVS